MRVSTHVPPRGIVEKQRLGGRERREIRAREGSRDVSWIHCDAFHVELFVLRVGVQFSGGYDTWKSGRPSPSPLLLSSWICARASFLLCRFTPPLRDRGRPSRRSSKERTFPSNSRHVDGRGCVTNVPRTRRIPFPLSLFLQLRSGSKDRKARVNFPFHSFENY